MWGRQSYRLSDIDFEANKREGIAVDWPVRYADIAPWYDKVEEFIGVSGEALGKEVLPDGVFSPPMELNCAERDLREKIDNNYDDGRVLTASLDGKLKVWVAHEAPKSVRGPAGGEYGSGRTGLLNLSCSTHSPAQSACTLS